MAILDWNAYCPKIWIVAILTLSVLDVCGAYKMDTLDMGTDMDKAVYASLAAERKSVASRMVVAVDSTLVSYRAEEEDNIAGPFQVACTSVVGP